MIYFEVSKNNSQRLRIKNINGLPYISCQYNRITYELPHLYEPKQKSLNFIRSEQGSEEQNSIFGENQNYSENVQKSSVGSVLTNTTLVHPNWIGEKDSDDDENGSNVRTLGERKKKYIKIDRESRINEKEEDLIEKSIQGMKLGQNQNKSRLF